MINKCWFLKDNLVRKLFGKKEIEITIKQLNGIRLTQSEKNRLSRDIRPKFKVIELLAKHTDLFNLKKNELNKRIINKTIKVILNDQLRKNICAILLFGSHVDNSQRVNSDIDIVVVFKDDLTLKEVTKFRKRILGQVSDKVDLQVFNALPLKIKKTIADKSKVLFKDAKFRKEEFAITIWKKYFDYKLYLLKYFKEAFI
ncbi:MAG: nucleotidyltransferase domain-containing protein [Nanoarchaeota archaeon]|nr:nucleotidyltransferase domain-containing protein [Nanoarchaeota archaeon]MBU1855000.1 nucleotidyltransferase domain-containing protein [Nanoarchaeota archaeon]